MRPHPAVPGKVMYHVTFPRSERGYCHLIGDNRFFQREQCYLLSDNEGTGFLPECSRQSTETQRKARDASRRGIDYTCSTPVWKLAFGEGRPARAKARNKIARVSWGWMMASTQPRAAP